MSAAYTPPSRGHDGHKLSVQPERFARTGAGLLGCGVLRDDHFGDALSYSLDAPPLVPRGSVEGGLFVPTIPQLQPWHYIDHADSRERL